MHRRSLSRLKTSLPVKEEVEKYLKLFPTKEIIPNIDIFIYIHYPKENKAKRRKYLSSFRFRSGVDTYCREFYRLRGCYFSNQKQVYLHYRIENEKYVILLTPEQQHEMIKKLLNDGYFELENFMNIEDLFKSNREPDNKKSKALQRASYIGIGVNELVFINDTPKNKKVIDEYLNWMRLKFQSELLKHPADKWPDE